MTDVHQIEAAVRKDNPAVAAPVRLRRLAVSTANATTKFLIANSGSLRLRENTPARPTRKAHLADGNVRFLDAAACPSTERRHNNRTSAFSFPPVSPGRTYPRWPLFLPSHLSAPLKRWGSCCFVEIAITDVARDSPSPELDAKKSSSKTIIVANGGERGGVGRQRQRRQALARVVR